MSGTRCTAATSRGIGGELGALAGPHDHRRDHVARARRVVVEAAEHLRRRGGEADLLGELAERALDRRLAGSTRPPGSAHWPGMRA